MARRSLEYRLMALESAVFRLRAKIEALKRPNDWQRVVGMFAGDEFMKSVDEAGLKIRAADRKRTMHSGRKGRKKPTAR